MSMTSAEMKALTHQYVMNTYGRFDVAIDHGEGSRLYDPEGREYIDLTSGIGVTDLGYGYQPWVDAIAAQAKKLNHVSNLFYTEPSAKLAEILCKRTGMSCVFYANGGGEANEGMIKLARKYSYDKYGKGRGTIITLHKSFHGRTITTLAATGQDKFHDYFFPFTEGFRYADANNMDTVMAAAGDDVCAIMMELIQGEGGVNPLDVEFVQAVAKLCEERDWLLLIDEVQTGVGRTGSLFAFQQYGIQPDVVSFAKGIAGGLKKIYLMLSYPSDEVGNHLIDLDAIDAAGVNPYSDVLDEAKYRELFGYEKHTFTGVDYVEYYGNLIRESGAECEIIFSNNPTTILNYTKEFTKRNFLLTHYFCNC